MTPKINYIKNSDELAVNLKKARKKAELTQKQVSRILNIDRATLSYYETGISLPSIFTLIKLSEIYCISIYQLIIRECSHKNGIENQFQSYN